MFGKRRNNTLKSYGGAILENIQRFGLSTSALLVGTARRDPCTNEIFKFIDGCHSSVTVGFFCKNSQSLQEVRVILTEISG